MGTNDNPSYFSVGYDFMDRFALIESQMDRRFAMINNMFTQNLNYQVNKFADIDQYLKTLNEENKFLKWYINIPWYKKIWYGINKINFKDIYGQEIHT